MDIYLIRKEEKKTTKQPSPSTKRSIVWSEMTLNYWMMVERYPNFKEEVGSSNPDCEISSLPDGNFPGGELLYVLWCWLVGLLSQKKEKKRPIVKPEKY